MKKTLVVVLAAFAMLAGSGIGQAASDDVSCGGSTCSATDHGDKTIEPILTRSSAQPLYAEDTPVAFPANRDQNVNIKHFSLSAGGGKITVRIDVNSALTRSNGDLVNTAPYAGNHVMALFQTKLLEVNQPTGTNAAGRPTTWGPPGTLKDNFHWFLYWGWTASEQREVCGLGYYDPTGEVVPPVPVAAGQTFFSIGQTNATAVQNPNTHCVVSNGSKTVTITQPYRYTYADRTGILPRSVKILDPSNVNYRTISNVKAFSWLDQEIGGPDPVGLVFGYTWYADSLPKAGYDIGLVAGDPNPNKFAGPDCVTNYEFGSNPVTGAPYNPNCTTNNPVGAGFNKTPGTITVTN
ncbi:MAG: hypothetical protein NVSMB57_00200 [Actinomycetota bacterium]